MINFRKADINDLTLYYDWANDDEVRKNSYTQEVISFENHVRWFKGKLQSNNTLMLVFYLTDTHMPVGQVRFEVSGVETTTIGISVDKSYRGKGYASVMLKMASLYYISLYPEHIIYALIKKENKASYLSFLKAGFNTVEEIIYNNTSSFKLAFNE